MRGLSAPFDDRLAAESFSPLELAALQWLDGFYQLEHLIATRAWLLVLYPQAAATLRFAALVHDAERHFPGGLTLAPDAAPDDPDYLYAHSLRSADLVSQWLDQRQDKMTAPELGRIRALILRHEFGGDWEEDLVQAADSLAFLSTFDWLVVEWIRSGARTREQAQDKVDWMLTRIRVQKATKIATPIYREISKFIENSNTINIDTKRMRENAGKLELLKSYIKL